MKLLRAALAASRSRAWSVAIGRSKGGVEVGILGGHKIKSPGNGMNCPDNQ